MYHHTRNRLLTRVLAPAGEPLTLAETKLYLRIDGNHEDTLIGDLIVAARMIAEEWLRLSLITQSWLLAYDGVWPALGFVSGSARHGLHHVIVLPMGPVNAIASVVAVARDNSSQALDSSVYFLNAAKNEIILDWVLDAFRIEITYSAGFGSAADVPRPIKQGLLAHIAAMYDNRGDTDSALPEQSIRLYMPYREVRL